MKKLIAMVMATASIGAFGEFVTEEITDFVRFESAPNGQSYAVFTKGVENCTMTIDHYGDLYAGKYYALGYQQEGHFGYYVFEDGLSGKALTDYIKNNGNNIPDVGVNDNPNKTYTVYLGDVAAGTKIGYYLNDFAGVLRTQYEFTSAGIDRYGDTREVIDNGGETDTAFVDFDPDVVNYITTGHFITDANDELVRAWGNSVSSSTSQKERGLVDHSFFGPGFSSGRDDWVLITFNAHSLHGTPLPGSVAVMLVGMLFAGAGKMRRRS